MKNLPNRNWYYPIKFKFYVTSEYLNRGKFTMKWKKDQCHAFLLLVSFYVL